LCHGSGCDSSEDADFRIKFVLKAERQFIEANQRIVLKLAAKLVQNEIDEIKELLK